MTLFELLTLAVMVAVFIALCRGPRRAPFICEVPGCCGTMDVVRPSSIVKSAEASGVSRDQAVREVAGFYAATGIKLIYGCTRCGKMKGMKL